MIINKGDWNVANGYSFAFYNGGVGDVLMCEIEKVWGQGVTYPASNFSTKRWYHVVCMADSTGHRNYVNGSLVASNATAIGTVTDTNILRMGAWFSSCPGVCITFDGLIDDRATTASCLRMKSNGCTIWDDDAPSYRMCITGAFSILFPAVYLPHQ
jgi:hypothetical protein